MGRYRGRKGMSTDDTLLFVVWVLLIIFLMPLTGLYFLLRKDPSKRWLGWVLLIAGMILWIAAL